MKIYNVKVVKTEVARGIPLLCRNQKSFWQANAWWFVLFIFFKQCFSETPYCPHQSGPGLKLVKRTMWTQSSWLSGLNRFFTHLVQLATLMKLLGPSVPILKNISNCFLSLSTSDDLPFRDVLPCCNAQATRGFHPQIWEVKKLNLIGLERPDLKK